MFLSKKLLIQLIPDIKNVSYFKLSSSLTDLGIEVEKRINHPTLKNLVSGEIIELRKHENADTLNVTKVCVGNNMTFNIICGAKDLFVGQKVVVALEGAKLHDGRMIGNRELRGVESQGMLCGFNELTPYFLNCLTEDELDGIISLDKDTKNGQTNITEILGLDDEIYDLSLPTNRPEINSPVFLASDIANNLDLPLKKSNLSNLNTLKPFNICGLKNNESYAFQLDKYETTEVLWAIKSRLINAGSESINRTESIVKYASYLAGTNVLMINSDGNTNLIEKYLTETTEVIIFNKKIKINTSTPVLVNQKNEIVAIPNVEIVDNHKPINGKPCLIYFSNYISKSKSIFEENNIFSQLKKHQPKKQNKFMLDNFCIILSYLMTNKNVENFLFLISDQTKEIPFNTKECLSLLGDGKVRTFNNSLKKLNYKISNEKITIPKYRTDIVSTSDICEEIVKTIGINNLEQIPIHTSLDVKKANNVKYQILYKIKKLLTTNYMYEAKTYNLQSKEDLNKFNVFNLKPCYELNPCSNLSRRFMRISLIDSLLGVLAYNNNRKIELKPVFEIQKIYSDKTLNNLTCVCPEKTILDSINNVKFCFNTFGLKAIATEIATLFKKNIEFKPNSSTSSFFYTNDYVEIYYCENIIGYIGCLKKNLCKDHKLDKRNIYAMSMNLNKLLENAVKKDDLIIKKIPETSSIYKDVTFDATKHTNIGNIIYELKNLKYLNTFKFTNVFTIDENNVAYTVNLEIFNVKEATLNKREIDLYLNNIYNIILDNKATIKGI